MVNAVTEDDPLPPHVVEEIARRSAGSPLFLFELLDVVRETGSVEALPDSVEAVVAADIDRLAPADRTVLRYAAVLGTSFDPQLLARPPPRRCRARRRRLERDSATSSSSTRRGRAPLPQHPHPRRRVRGTAVPASPRAPRPGRRGDRGDLRRGGGRRARAPLLRGAALRRGLALLQARRRPRDGDLRQRRGRSLLRARAARRNPCARRSRIASARTPGSRSARCSRPPGRSTGRSWRSGGQPD